MKKGLFSHTQAVFDALIASGRPAYCRQVKLSPKEAVDLLHGAGGIAVLAHPAEIEDPAWWKNCWIRCLSTGWKCGILLC